MSISGIIKTLEQYRKTSSGSRKYRKYFQAFEEKMLYRTTKTENPHVTKRMVRAVLNKFR